MEATRGRSISTPTAARARTSPGVRIARCPTGLPWGLGARRRSRRGSFSRLGAISGIRFATQVEAAFGWGSFGRSCLLQFSRSLSERLLIEGARDLHLCLRGSAAA